MKIFRLLITLLLALCIFLVSEETKCLGVSGEEINDIDCNLVLDTCFSGSTFSYSYTCVDCGKDYSYLLNYLLLKKIGNDYEYKESRREEKKVDIGRYGNGNYHIVIYEEGNRKVVYQESITLSGLKEKEEVVEGNKDERSQERFKIGDLTPHESRGEGYILEEIIGLTIVSFLSLILFLILRIRIDKRKRERKRNYD